MRPPPHLADVLVDFAEAPAESRVKLVFDAVFSTSWEVDSDGRPFIAYVYQQVPYCRCSLNTCYSSYIFQSALL